MVDSSVGDVIVREIASGARHDASVLHGLASASGTVCASDATSQVSVVLTLVPQERLNGCRDGGENGQRYRARDGLDLSSVLERADDACGCGMLEIVNGLAPGVLGVGWYRIPSVGYSESLR